MYVHETEPKRPRRLPRSWQNVSGLDKLSDDELRALGWYPFHDAAAPEVDRVSQIVTSEIVIDGGRGRREWSVVDRDPADAAAVLEREREAALRRAFRLIDEVGERYLSQYPQAERESWHQQASAATAVLRGDATADEEAFIDALAAPRGLSRTEMATRIKAKVDKFSALATALVNARVGVEAALKAATTGAEIDAAIQQLETNVAAIEV